MENQVKICIRLEKTESRLTSAARFEYLMGSDIGTGAVQRGASYFSQSSETWSRSKVQVVVLVVAVACCFVA